MLDAPRAELIWASPREVLNVVQADQVGCHIITITHDLLANILQSAEMRLKKIQVTSLTNEVFFARLFLAVNGKEVEIDSRPSDAIALAVRMTCPILVSQDVLDKAGVFPEKEEEEEDKLSIFKELINSMDLPDLEGPPPEKS